MRVFFGEEVNWKHFFFPKEQGVLEESPTFWKVHKEREIKKLHDKGFFIEKNVGVLDLVFVELRS